MDKGVFMHTLYTTQVHIWKCLFIQLCVIMLVTANMQNSVDDQSYQDDDKLLPCPDHEHVFATMLQVDNEKSFDDGTYCRCPDNQQPIWNENDGKSITWHHHERDDWIVQYRFCDPIMKDVSVCRDKEEMALIIRTDAKGWNPRIRKLYCKCTTNRYHLVGWTLDRGNHWDYHYTCQTPTCQNDIDSPCLRHYVDSGKTFTTGYKFMCTCPEGQHCPTEKLNFDKLTIDGVDNTGPYVQGHCRRIHSDYANKNKL